MGAYSPILGSMISLLLIILTTIYGIRDSLQWPFKVNASEIRSLLGGGLKLHINTIGSYPPMTVDIIILGQFRGMEEVGLYQAAMQFVAVPRMLPAVITMVLFSEIAERRARSSMGHAPPANLAGYDPDRSGRSGRYFIAPSLIPFLLEAVFPT